MSVEAEDTAVVEPSNASAEPLNDMGVTGVPATGLSIDEGVIRRSDLLRGLRLCCSAEASLDA